MAKMLLALVATIGCGEVVPPSGPVDAGTDAGQPPSCTDYCAQATTCGWEVEATCCANCDCILTYQYREEVRESYIRCLRDEPCSGSPTRCLDVAIEGVDPTSTGSGYATVCEKRQSADCPSLDCSIGLYYSDAALAAIVGCLDTSYATCADVEECIAANSTAACRDAPDC